MIRYFTSLLILFSMALFAESPILVTLRDNQTLPLGYAPATSDGSIPHPYEKALEKTFVFDLERAGYFETVPLEPSPFEALPDKIDFRRAGHVIKMRLEDKKFFVKLYIEEKEKITLFSTAALSGKLEKDRRTVHALFDRFQKVILGKEGIASTKILYTCRPANDKSELVEIDYDGYNEKRYFPDHNYIITPTYYPEPGNVRPRTAFFVSYKNGQPKIYVGNLESGETKPLTKLRGNAFMPALSPQGDKCAFISDASGNPDLFLQCFSRKSGALGKPMQLLSYSSGVQGSPSFSPDGNKLAFVSNQDGVPRIYMMDIPHPGAPLLAREKKLVSRLAREGTAPCWSPDGTKIAFSSGKRGERQIWIYDLVENDEYPITKGAGSKEKPSFAPDSFHLVYHMRNEDSSELYIIDLLKKKPYRITSGHGEKRFASWEPRN